MIPRLSVRRMATIAVLTFSWCALWGEANIANVASGLLIGVVVSSSAIGTAGRGRVRLRPLVRFAALVAVDLVASTVTVAREIISPADGTDEAIVAVHLPSDARRHHLLLIVAVTVTPGTAVIDADPDTGTLYLHLLHADRRQATAAHVAELARLACEGLPAADPLDVPVRS